MRLIRELRCSPDADPAQSVANTWAGPFDPSRCATHWTLRVGVDGPVDSQTGYLCDIKRLDDALRRHVWSRLATAGKRATSFLADMARALLQSRSEFVKAMPPGLELATLELQLSAYVSLGVRRGEDRMVTLTRAFEFSAAHRLSVEHLSDEENLRLFGKCSNPNGHGHNYVLEVTIRGNPDQLTGALVSGPQFDHVVNERVIVDFDHKNLNVECREFASLNPTVENMATVIWRRLEGAFDPCQLAGVRVWETPKTCAEISAAPAP